MPEHNKTLIILTPGFASSAADTTCLPFLQSHVHALNRCFPSIKIIIIAFQYPYFKGNYKWNGNEVIAFGGRERGKINRLFLWLSVWTKLRELKKKKNIIGLFSLWCTECAWIGSYFGKYNHLKHFTWICGQDAKASNRYVALIRPVGGELIAMSDFLKREFYKSHHIAPAHVIPLGVDPSTLSTEHHIRNIDVLGIGSLIPLKQYNVFITIIAEVAKDLPHINAVICGKGPEEANLASLIDALILHKNETLNGEMPHKEVLALMQRAKVFLHTSNYEGFGTVCLEALCTGAHVVSFTKPMDNAIRHWHHVHTDDEMVKKVLELLNDQEISYEPVIPYTTSGVAQSMMNLFTS